MDNTDMKAMTVKELRARIQEVINIVPRGAKRAAKGHNPYVVFSFIGTDGKEHNIRPRQCEGGYLYDGAHHQTKDRVFRIEYAIHSTSDAREILDGFVEEFLTIEELFIGLSKSVIFSDDMLNAPVCFSQRTFPSQDDSLIGICSCAAEKDEEGLLVLKLQAAQDKQYDIDINNLSDGVGLFCAYAGEYAGYFE